MKNAIIFLAGVACGAAGAYFFLKDKFADIAQKEIDSVKDSYKKVAILTIQDDGSVKEVDPPVTVKNEKPPIKEYFKTIEKYQNYNKVEVPEDSVHKSFNEDPYVISPEEFGEIEDYEQESLVLYSDGVLANDVDDEIFEEADEKLTPDFDDHFGDYEENAVHIRNDIEKTDYAIYKDSRSYEEVTGNKPSRPVMED